MRQAVIDIGTNSIKLLLAELVNHSVRPIMETSRQTRLGEGFYTSHLLQPLAIERTTEAILELIDIAAKHQVTSPRIMATSAAREAKNQTDLINAVQSATHIDLEILSGDQEARLAFTGVCTDPELQGRRLLILDVGGGSSEFILGMHGHPPQWIRSFELGNVRLLEKLRPKDPPTSADWERCKAFLQDFQRQVLAPQLPLDFKSDNHPLEIVATGGTPSILARIIGKFDSVDRDRIESIRASTEILSELRQHLWSLPLVERRKVTGLPANRADVMLYGVAIYESFLDMLGHPDFKISTRGIRFGALLP